jgi:hypothetical protein
VAVARHSQTLIALSETQMSRRNFFADCALPHTPVAAVGVMARSGVIAGLGFCAMRVNWFGSPMVFQASLAIILVELMLLSIGLDLAPAGVEPAIFGAP